MYSEHVLSALLYFITIAMSLGAGGAFAESCDELSGSVICSDRVKAFIAFSFLTALVAIPLLVANLINIPVMLRFEVIPAAVAVLFAIIASAIGTSPRSGNFTLLPLLMWYSFIALTGAAFLALNKNTTDHSSKEKDVDHLPGSVPLNASTTSSIPAPPMQPLQPLYTAPTQPVAPAPAAKTYSPPV